MKIVHLNVRATEGGAAKIATMLHKDLRAKNLLSKFYYGYGRRGRASAIVDDSVFMLSSPTRSRLNFVSSRIFGIDCFSGSSKAMSELTLDINSATVVHLHAIHSYFINYDALFEMLKNSSVLRKIVITLHDFWFLTGRCAIKGTCTLWESGCIKCPNLDAYPSTVFDLAKFQAIKKRDFVNNFLDKVIFVCPSRYMCDDVKKVFPSADVRTIPNGLSVEFENNVDAAFTHYSVARSNKLKILVIASDLSDKYKIDQNLVRLLINEDFIEIHCVGKNCNFTGENVTWHGEVKSTSALVAIYMSVDYVLFTSTIDTFGLVIIESLACGTPVLALKSGATDEIFSHFGHLSYSNADQLKDAVLTKKLVVNEIIEHRKLTSRITLDAYSARAMLSSYSEVYFDAT